ncbi:MAG: hypothetical protein ACT4P1_11075 [Sporichthyaceae bacterium]
MVLPSDYHWALRGWMRLHGIEAHELAGTLLVGDLDELLLLSGAAHQLRPEERVLLTTSRSLPDADRAEWLSDCDASTEELRVQVGHVLDEVCQALSDAGVPASLWEGAGVISGDEVFDALVCVDETDRLYELMRAEGFAAEPDWDAPPFRERVWPES